MARTTGRSPELNLFAFACLLTLDGVSDLIEPQSEAVFELGGLPDPVKFCGHHDRNLTTLEQIVPIVVRLDGERLHLRGGAGAVGAAKAILERMRDLAVRGATLTSDDVRLAAEGTQRGSTRSLPATIATTARGKEIRPKTESQRRFVEAIDAHALTFGIGPAGTGKTFLAVATAVRALKDKQIARIVLTRPAVEAGEKLGFLPGDLKEKVDPYLRPLYDALSELLDDPAVAKSLERGAIEVAPLAYMRGRTLSDAFIILDEAQNATRAQMKMFLTRLGANSKMIVNGDVTQIDLPRSERSGLLDAHALFDDVPEIAIVEFGEADVVRDPLVGKIVTAYRRFAERSGELARPVIRDLPPQ